MCVYILYTLVIVLVLEITIYIFDELVVASFDALICHGTLIRIFYNKSSHSICTLFTLTEFSFGPTQRLRRSFYQGKIT